ncbi:MAG: GAF domain-containing sensor histidine kinase, partial [Gemmatimonadota bacterium]|nr:GAF domain-containing sensor histidine kinase [Gemmatimonadota bacterium]
MTRAPAASGDTRLHTPAEGVDFGLRELMAVREIVHAFLTADRPEEVFQFALDRVSPVVGATFACVYLIDGASELMRLAAAYNWPERFTPFLGEMRVRLGFGPSGEAASERRAIEVPDIFSDPSLEDWQEVANELGFQSLVALPLQTGAGVLGTVTFYFGAAGGLSVESRSLLRMVADQMAATAQKARLIDDLRRANSALTDTNAELERQYAALLEARRLQDEFLANLSTDLRAPLAELVGYISRIESGAAGPVTEGERTALLEVKASGEVLLDRIGDLIELSELKRNEVEPAVSVFDVREPMREALALVVGRREGVALQSAEPEAGVTMASDRRRVVRLLSRLLRNAYAFTERGAVRTAVEVHDDRVVYRVEDTGVGIPVDAQRTVFEEFRRAGAPARPQEGGRVGAGL